MSKPIAGNGDSYINYPSIEKKKGSTHENTIPLHLLDESLILTPSEDTPLIFSADLKLDTPLKELAERVDELSIHITQEESTLLETEIEPAVSLLRLSLVGAADVFNEIAHELQQTEASNIIDQLLQESSKNNFFFLNNKFFVRESEQHLVKEKVKEARKNNPQLEQITAYVIKDEEWQGFKELILTILKQILENLGVRIERSEKKSSDKKAKALSKVNGMKRGEGQISEKKSASNRIGIDWKEVQTKAETEKQERISEEREREVRRNKEFTAKKKLKKFRDTERKEKKREEVRLENQTRESQLREKGI